MLNRYLTEELPPEIFAFIEKYKIKVVNNARYLGRGADPVFFWLTCKSTPGALQLAVDNIEIDDRFTKEQREELLSIIENLNSQHEFYVRQVLSTVGNIH